MLLLRFIRSLCLNLTRAFWVTVADYAKDNGWGRIWLWAMKYRMQSSMHGLRGIVARMQAEPSKQFHFNGHCVCGCTTWTIKTFSRAESIGDPSLQRVHDRVASVLGLKPFVYRVGLDIRRLWLCHAAYCRNLAINTQQYQLAKLEGREAPRSAAFIAGES
jgi:hypothetical protein